MRIATPQKNWLRYTCKANTKEAVLFSFFFINPLIIIKINHFGNYLRLPQRKTFFFSVRTLWFHILMVGFWSTCYHRDNIQETASRAPYSSMASRNIRLTQIQQTNCISKSNPRNAKAFPEALLELLVTTNVGAVFGPIIGWSYNRTPTASTNNQWFSLGSMPHWNVSLLLCNVPRVPQLVAITRREKMFPYQVSSRKANATTCKPKGIILQQLHPQSPVASTTQPTPLPQSLLAQITNVRHRCSW